VSARPELRSRRASVAEGRALLRLAGQLVKGTGYGLIGDIIVGIVGASSPAYSSRTLKQRRDLLRFLAPFGHEREGAQLYRP